MLAQSPEPDAEEYAIHDYAGYGSYRFSEYGGKPLPITDTGYYSIFISEPELAQAGGPVAYVIKMIEHDAKKPTLEKQKTRRGNIRYSKLGEIILKLPVNIHAFMQNADDVNAAAACHIDNQMLIMRVNAHGRGQLVAFTANKRRIRKEG